MDVDQALISVRQLWLDLKEISKRDPEQEVGGIALPVVDRVLAAARDHAPEGDPVLGHDLISPESVEAGEPVRAVDAYIYAGQLIAALERARSAQPHEPLKLTPEPGPFDRW